MEEECPGGVIIFHIFVWCYHQSNCVKYKVNYVWKSKLVEVKIVNFNLTSFCKNWYSIAIDNSAKNCSHSAFLIHFYNEFMNESVGRLCKRPSW